EIHLDLEDHRFLPITGDLNCLVNLGHAARREFAVDNRAQDLDDLALAAVLLSVCGTDAFLCSLYLGHVPLEIWVNRQLELCCRASAPPTISSISLVMASCRALLKRRVRSSTSALAFSVALRIATIRAECSLASASTTAWNSSTSVKRGSTSSSTASMLGSKARTACIPPTCSRALSTSSGRGRSGSSRSTTGCWLRVLMKRVKAT